MGIVTYNQIYYPINASEVLVEEHRPSKSEIASSNLVTRSKGYQPIKKVTIGKTINGGACSKAGEKDLQSIWEISIIFTSTFHIFIDMVKCENINDRSGNMSYINLKLKKTTHIINLYQIMLGYLSG